jgi:hypothetical protein
LSSKKEPKFYRTLIAIEVLSATPYPLDNDQEGNGNTCPMLDQISYDITAGDCSGLVKTVVENEEVEAYTMRRLLERQGSDPDFLTSDGGDFPVEPLPPATLIELDNLEWEKIVETIKGRNAYLTALAEKIEKLLPK